MAGFFITGTDTGVGKTWAAVRLMHFLRARGFSVIGMKPVASGCMWQDGGWRNEDALMLQEAASLPVDYAKLNIYAFPAPIAPHLAARQLGLTIALDAIVSQYHELERLADCVVVEGVGGWEVPLNEHQRVADLAKALKLPVILVVGMRLGCLNHALLTQDAMRRAGVECVGWIANCLAPDFLCLAENIQALHTELAFPCVGVIPHDAENFPIIGKDTAFFGTQAEEILRRLA